MSTPQTGIVVLVDAQGGVVTNLAWNPATLEVTSSTGTNAELTLADAGAAGLMSAQEHVKLLNIEAGAQANEVLNSDPRLSNARTPTLHAASHAAGGGDAITPASILAVASNPGGITGAEAVPNLVRISGANYDLLGNIDANTLYVVDR